MDADTNYEKLKHLELDQVINKWCKWKKEVEKHEPETISNNRRKLIQVFRDIDIDIKKTPLKELLDDEEDLEKLRNKLKDYKEFHLSRLRDKSIPETEKLKHNSIASLFSPVNPFFEKYLGMPKEKIHINTIGKKTVYKQRVTMDQVNKLIESIDTECHLKINLTNSEKKKMEYRKRWATERTAVIFLKYLWTRSKEITEGNITMKDIKIMKETNCLPLHTKKRLNNPKPFQQPVVLKEVIEAWNIYEKYRDSSDISDNAPAIVQVNKQGKAIRREWLRDIIKKHRRAANLPEYITPHAIRAGMHTLLRSKCNNKKIAQIHLGDVSSKVADSHYNIPDAEMIREELEKMYRSDDIVPGERKTPMEKQKSSSYSGDMAYA